MSAPKCPACKALLDKMPQRKTKCKACGEFMFIKDTPHNRTKRLMTTAQVEAAERAWEAHYAKQHRKEAVAVYKELLKSLAANLAKCELRGVRSVQVFGANDRTCSVCNSLMGAVLPVSTPAEDILRTDCERFIEGNYHCAPMVSAAIRDGRGNVRFDRENRF